VNKRDQARLSLPIGTRLDRPILGAGRLAPGFYSASVRKVEEGNYSNCWDITWVDEVSGDSHLDRLYTTNFDKKELHWSYINYRSALAPDLECQRAIDVYGPEMFKGCKADITIAWSEGWQLYKDSTTWCALDGNGQALSEWYDTAKQVVEAMGDHPRAVLRLMNIVGDDGNIERMRKQYVHSNSKRKV
jgi:hypothetical protein